MKKYSIDAKTGCWNWLGATIRGGYGFVWNKEIKKCVVAHRYFFERFKKKIPDGMVLDHLCRNSKCVNPDHLEIVTNAENLRRAKSIKVGWELSNRIKEIYYAGKKTQFEIALLFNLNQGTISRIVNGKRWNPCL